MLKRITRITTADTKKTYELPGEDIPQLWAAELRIACVDQWGRHSIQHKDTETTIYLERNTLRKAKLLPQAMDEQPLEQEETAEDMMLRLLEHLGFYPQNDA